MMSECFRFDDCTTPGPQPNLEIFFNIEAMIAFTMLASCKAVKDEAFLLGLELE
jgi:hypothetical protein